MKIINNSKINTAAIEEMLSDFYPFAKSRFGFSKDPVLEFISDEKNANNIGLKSISKLRRLQKDYDRRTNHGQTQGASGASIFRYLNDS